MNDFCSKIVNIFLESKETSFENKHFAAINNNNKRWFGRQCQSARRKYHIARKIKRRHPSTTNHRKLKEASQSNKQKMNFHIKKFNRNIQEKLRKLKIKNPKEYWNIINSLDRNNENSSIDLDTLSNFFKDMNVNKNTNDEEENEINIDITDDDEILNSWITEAEILKCIRSIKNNKCSGNDQIINEYLKNSIGKMLSIYISFFNLIVETGIIPES